MLYDIIVFQFRFWLLPNTDAYFRKTGLERSDALSKDLEWMSEQDIVIPEPSSPGVTYVKYLEELAETSPSLFLSHFYNIYFSHIAGGQVIAKQVYSTCSLAYPLICDLFHNFCLGNEV